jgi:hypothetical protein
MLVHIHLREGRLAAAWWAVEQDQPRHRTSLELGRAPVTRVTRCGGENHRATLAQRTARKSIAVSRTDMLALADVPFAKGAL